MDNKVLDEAVEVLVTRLDLNPDYFGAEEIRESFLAGVKVLLGEPVAWRARGMSDAWVYADKPVQHFINTPWEPLYAPSLGEGDGR